MLLIRPLRRVALLVTGALAMQAAWGIVWAQGLNMGNVNNPPKHGTSQASQQFGAVDFGRITTAPRSRALGRSLSAQPYGDVAVVLEDRVPHFG
jgi:hypothetical protein